MKKLLLISFVIASVAKQSHAQTTFSKVYYDMAMQAITAKSIVPTPDNKYIIAGTYNYNGGGYILKVDSAGNEVWSKRIGANQSFNSVCATLDSNYVASGINYYCKFDSAGTIIWEKALSSNNTVLILSIKQTNDSGFVMSGTVASSSPNALFIAKTDASGNLQWSKIMTAGNYMNEGIAVKQAADSTYYLAGTISFNPPYSFSAFIVHLSPSGNILWMKKYSNVTFFNDFILINNGLLLYVNGNNGNVEIAKTDISGNIVWNKAYPMAFGNFHMNGMNYYPKIIETSDSGFVFVNGSCFMSGAAKIDSIGNLIWASSVWFDVIEPVETKDKGFVLVGNGPMCGVKAMPSPNPQIGLYKIDSLGAQSNSWNCVGNMSITASAGTLASFSESATTINTVTLTPVASVVSNVPIATDSGCVAIIGAVAETDINNFISVSPNPSSGVFQITSEAATLSLSKGQIEIYNVLGEQIQVNSQQSAVGNNRQIINLSSFPDGIYFVKVKTEQGSAVKKIIIQH